MTESTATSTATYEMTAIEGGIDDGIEDPDLAQYEDLAQRRDLAQYGDPPAREGELQVRRPPGVRVGPYPDIQIIVTATTEHLAAARLHTAGPPPRHPSWTDPLDLGLTSTPISTSVPRMRHRREDQRRRERHRRERQRAAPAVARAVGSGSRTPNTPDRSTPASWPCSPAPARSAASSSTNTAPSSTSAAATASHHPPRKPHYSRGTSAASSPAAPPPGTSATSTTSSLDRPRRHRHRQLALLCPRHHAEVTDGTWEIEMLHGVPWARPPAWAHPTRPLLRNTSHHGRAAA